MRRMLSERGTPARAIEALQIHARTHKRFRDGHVWRWVRGHPGDWLVMGKAAEEGKACYWFVSDNDFVRRGWSRWSDLRSLGKGSVEDEPGRRYLYPDRPGGVRYEVDLQVVTALGRKRFRAVVKRGGRVLAVHESPCQRIAVRLARYEAMERVRWCTS